MRCLLAILPFIYAVERKVNQPLSRFLSLQSRLDSGIFTADYISSLTDALIDIYTAQYEQKRQIEHSKALK